MPPPVHPSRAASQAPPQRAPASDRYPRPVAREVATSRDEGRIPGLPSERFLSGAARDAIARAVRENGGHEVFFLGRAADGVVVDVEDVARGNAHMVPALRRLADGYDVAIHNHPSGDLCPSDADLAIAAELGDLRVAFFIVSNDATHLNPVVKLFPKEPPPPSVPADLCRWALSGDGPIAQRLPGYEPRASQLDMAARVAEAVSTDAAALIEAGTGTGKSLAYLIPALLRARRGKGQRVVISTHTIHLQEQLVQKDVPFVLSQLAEIERAAGGGPEAPPTVALMKGRGHYACLRKIDDLASTPEAYFDSDEERGEVLALARWAKTAKEGVRQELAREATHGAWDKVSVDPDTCTRTACDRYQECFYYQARRAAASADVLVANHALVLADLSIRRQTGFQWSAVLPPYRHLVVDEAHHLEDVACQHLGHRVTSLGVRRLLGRLQRARRHEKGLLPGLLSALLARPGAGPIARSIDEEALPLRQLAGVKASDLFQSAQALAAAIGRSGNDAAPPGIGDGSASHRLERVHEQLPEFHRFADAAEEMATSISALGTVLERAIDRIDHLPEADVNALRGVRLETEGAAKRLRRLRTALEGFARPDPDGPPEVRWIELTKFRRTAGIALRSAPLTVSDLLRREIYPNLGGVVFTSATLATGGSFAFIRERLGLNADPDGSTVGGAIVRAPQPADPDEVTFVPASDDDAVFAEGPGVGDEPGPSAAPRAPTASKRAPRAPEPPPKLVTELLLASPFDYAAQTILGLPQDLPEPQDPGFDRALPEVVRLLCEASSGGAFILFTSHRQLRSTYQRIAPALASMGLQPLQQGALPKRALLDRFRESGRAVLFGTDSFWEGVDVRGRALRLVVIVKLPFRSPQDPLHAARTEALERSGRSAFWSLALPQAILKLKQGFGRLIRSRQDRGAVVLLDRRVRTRKYGPRCLAALPPARRALGPLAPAITAAVHEIAGDDAVV